MSRLLAYGFGLGLTALVAAPGFGSPDDDSYPLSTYPMFARPRDKPWLQYAEAVRSDGGTLRIAPELLGSGEVMQAAATVRRAVEGGDRALAALCASIAGQAARALPEARAVQIVSAQFDPVAYFVAEGGPEQKRVLARCEVGSAR